MQGLRSSGLGGEAPSGVSIHSSEEEEEEASQSKTVGFGFGRQPGVCVTLVSTVGLSTTGTAAATKAIQCGEQASATDQAGAGQVLV